MIITIQPAAQSEYAPKPYPFHVSEGGQIGRQDFWARQGVVTAVGFLDSLRSTSLDLHWEDYVEGDLEEAVGRYLITADADGAMHVHQQPVGSIQVTDGEPVLDPHQNV